MSKPKKRPRGRPRNPQNTALIAALIERQDAMARRTAAKILGFLDTHISVDQATYFSRQRTRRAAEVLLTIPAKCAESIAGTADAAKVQSFLDEEIRKILHDLADEFDADAGPAPGAPPSPMPAAPTARPSKTLAEARAQNATLGALWIDLRQRVVKLDDPPLGRR